MKDLRDNGRIILAYGEVTGHCHEVIADATGLPPDMAQAQYFEGKDGLRVEYRACVDAIPDDSGGDGRGPAQAACAAGCAPLLPRTVPSPYHSQNTPGRRN